MKIKICHYKVFSLLFCYQQLCTKGSLAQDLPSTTSPTPYSSTFEYPTPPDVRMYFDLPIPIQSAGTPYTTRIPKTTFDKPLSSSTTETTSLNTEITLPPTTYESQSTITTITPTTKSTSPTTTLSRTSLSTTVPTTTTKTLPTTPTESMPRVTDETSTTSSSTSEKSKISTPLIDQTTVEGDKGETTTDSSNTPYNDLNSSTTVSTGETLPIGDSLDQVKSSSFGDVVLTAAISGILLLLTFSIAVVFLRQRKRLKVLDYHCQTESQVYYAYPLPSYPVSYMY